MFVLEPDFLPTQTVAAILAEDAAYGGRRNVYPNGGSDWFVSDVCPENGPPLVGRVVSFLRRVYQLPDAELDYAAFAVCPVGVGHHLHGDAVKADGTPNHTPNRVATGVIYLGTQGDEFDGGEVLLPAVGAVARPRAGMLITFATDWTHRHEVPPVTRGTRRSVAVWLKTKGT